MRLPEKPGKLGARGSDTLDQQIGWELPMGGNCPLALSPTEGRQFEAFPLVVRSLGT